MDSSALGTWAFIIIVAILLAALLLTNILKRFIPFLNKSLIPSSVLGGIILLIISTIVYYCIGHKYLFDLFYPQAEVDMHSGINVLEVITYHCLGIGFIAMGMRTNKKKLTKQRVSEVVNTGITTVSGYFVQVIIGLVVTILCVEVLHVSGLIDASGILLAFGFGQGTGQALNYGNIFSKPEYGMEGGGNFGLTIAAMGFLVACIVGVIYINILRRKGIVKVQSADEKNTLLDYEDENEIPHVASLDKFTIQVAIVFAIYAISYVIMWGLGMLIPFLKNVLFGFNFLIGVLLTIPVKAVLNKLEAKGIIKKKIVNNFMMARIGGFAFDMMIVAGVAAIQIPLLNNHWWVLVILAVLGGVGTFLYVFFVCKHLFPAYKHEQFLAMFGMLTGTASTGMILLREIDGSYKSPASENLVFQNLPAMVLGVPLMFLAEYAAKGMVESCITLAIVVVYGVVLNVFLYRSKIFKRGRKVTQLDNAEQGRESAQIVEDTKENDNE